MASTLGPFAQPVGRQEDHEPGSHPADAQPEVLLYRNPNVTNLYVAECYGMYNYALLGVR